MCNEDDYNIDLNQYKEHVESAMEDKETVRIGLFQYYSLRNCLNKHLIKPILGDDYYNLANDTYRCDLFTCVDIRNKYLELKRNLAIFKLISLILFITIILMLIIKFR